MIAVHRFGFVFSLAIVVCISSASIDSEAQERAALAEIGQYDTKLVEVEGIPLVSTFKEDEGYGVWNLLIGQGERKLLCYEDGVNIDELREAHEGVQTIIEKNDDFKKEGVDLQSVTARGFYDGENEILNLTEILYLRGGSEYRLETDAGDEVGEPGEEQGEAEEYDRPVEQYIIFHEVGRPWLYAPAWWHYPSWWGCMWVDVHWWWRPWYDCGLTWYMDRYCYDWRYRRCNPHGSCDTWGRPYRSYDRRRGLYRDGGRGYYDKGYRTSRVRSPDSRPIKDYRAPETQVKPDRYRGITQQQKTYRRVERRRTYRSIEPRQRTYRSGVKYSRPTMSSRPVRSTVRSSAPSHRPSRSVGSRPSTTRMGRRR